MHIFNILKALLKFFAGDTFSKFEIVKHTPLTNHRNR